MEKLTALNKPLKLGKLTVKNRVWNSPLWTRSAYVTGEVSDRTIAHYVARARGGAGMITTEGVAVDGNHHWHEAQMRLDDDCFIPGHRRLVEEVHLYNVPIICQLHHAGMFGTDPVSPSGVPCADMGKIGIFIEPRVLTTAEVEKIRDKFIAAAARAQEAGYDGVEIHGATAYLLEQFFSPHNNKRNDKYGGSLERRMELALEILRGIRKVCGPDYIVGYTGADCDMVEGGITRDQTVALAKALEREGLTYFDIQTDGTYETFHLITASAGYRRQPIGQFDKTAFYKSVLNIVVTTRGAGEYDPAAWNEAFASNKCDAVKLGKQMLADPDVASKAISGHTEDIRPCIKCGNCLYSGEISAHQLTCSVNPGCGRYEEPVTHAAEKKKVLVIGGGPAGLEAARVSAERGHEVVLAEKSGRLGGNLYVASLPVGKSQFISWIDWCSLQCRKLGVKIMMETAADEKLVEEYQPDVIFLATGSVPSVPPIKGIDGKQIVKAETVLEKESIPHGRVIVAGGGEVGLETADYVMSQHLADSLTIIEMQSDVGMDMNPMDKAVLFGNDQLFPSYFRQGMKILTSTKIQEFREGSVLVMDNQFREYELPADLVILAMGYRAENSLYEKLKELCGHVYLIGDAVKARKLVDAIYQANYFARKI